MIEQTKAAVSFEAAALIVWKEPVFLFAAIFDFENTLRSQIWQMANLRTAQGSQIR